jgi:hypothetical protein
MSLTKNIMEQLQKAPPDQAAHIRASDEKLRLDLKLADWGRLGCLLTRLDIEHTREGQLRIDPVRISEKISYLEERLEIIESEGGEGRTILRSSPPRVDGEGVSFFEVVLDRSTRLSLVRYRYDHKTEERTAVPASLARDTLERLLGDLITMAQEAPAGVTGR